MIDTFQGDPALSININGATVEFKGGQPTMDQGLENQAQISLFTEEGWPGNFLLQPDNRVGSDFEVTARKAVTMSNLALLEKSAEAALVSPLFGVVTPVVTNPESWFKNIAITIEPPGGNRTAILLSQNGTNWINQAKKQVTT